MKMMKGVLRLRTIHKVMKNKDDDLEPIEIEISETGVVFINDEPVALLKIEYNDW